MHKLIKNVKEMNRMCCCMGIEKIEERKPVNLCCLKDRSMRLS